MGGAATRKPLAGSARPAERRRRPETRKLDSERLGNPWQALRGQHTPALRSPSPPRPVTTESRRGTCPSQWRDVISPLWPSRRHCSLARSVSKMRTEPALRASGAMRTSCGCRRPVESWRSHGQFSNQPRRLRPYLGRFPQRGSCRITAPKAGWGEEKHMSASWTALLQ